MTTRIVELRQGILKKNDELARGLRARFEAAGVLVLNLVSSPGTGRPHSWSAPFANCAHGARGPRRWWEIWKPTTTRAGWRPAGRPCGRSILTASAILKPK